MSEIIRKSDLSRLLGLSAKHTRVTAWVHQGMPVRDDGKLDKDIVLSWIKENINPQGLRFADRGVNKALAGEPAERPAGLGGSRCMGAKAVQRALDTVEMDDEDEPLTFAAAKAMRETFLGRKAKLDYQQAASRLLQADQVESKWSSSSKPETVCWPSLVGLAPASRICHAPRSTRLTVR